MRFAIARQRNALRVDGSGCEHLSNERQRCSHEHSWGGLRLEKSLRLALFIAFGLLITMAYMLLLELLPHFESQQRWLPREKRGVNTSIDELTAGIMEVSCHKIRCPGRKSKSLASRLMDLPDQPEWKTCPYKPFTRYVVFSDQHSGTMWLSGILNSHPFFYHVHEILCCDGYDGFSVTRWQEIFYNHVCREASSCGNSTFAGFGVQSNQGWGNMTAMKDVIPYYAQTNTKVLFLHRTNTIEFKLSATGVNREGRENVDSLSTLDSNFVRTLRNVTKERLTRYEATMKLLERWKVPTHYVTYEDLSRKKADAIIPIFQFLEVDTHSWKVASNKTAIWDPNLDWRWTLSSKKKHHKKTLKDRVANYDVALSVLEEIYPEGACMLRGDCPY